MENWSWLPYPAISFSAVIALVLSISSAAKLADDVFGEGHSAQKLGKFFRNSLNTPTFGRAYIGAAFLGERIYGPRIFSLRSILVSVASTTVWLTILILLSIVLYGKRSWVYHDAFTHKVSTNFLIFVFAGVAIDYLCASVARYLFLLALDRSSWAKLLCLAATLTFSGLTFFLLYGQTKYLLLSHPNAGDISAMAAWIKDPLQLHFSVVALTDWHFIPIGASQYRIENGNSEVIYAFPEGMLFMSSLLTSIWLIAHVFSHWLYALGMRVTALSRFLVKESAIEKRPLQSAATITAILALLPAWLISVLFHYFS